MTLFSTITLSKKSIEYILNCISTILKTTPRRVRPLVLRLVKYIQIYLNGPKRLKIRKFVKKKLVLRILKNCYDSADTVKKLDNNLKF